MFKQWHKFYNLEAPEAPPAGSGSVSGSKEMSKGDIFDFLNSDDKADDKIDLEDKTNKDDDKEDDKNDKDDKEIKKAKKSKATKDDDKEDDDTDKDDDEDEEDDENDELEDLLDEDEPDEEKLESMTPPRRREILKLFPDLFKKFPYLERAYYREQQFTKFFPDPQDAKEAIDKASTLDNFEKDLMDGNIKTTLEAVKNSDPKAFTKMVNGYLKTLADVDEKAYHHIIGNTIRHTIQSMVIEANDSGQEILKSAAQVLHQFIFGNSKWTPPTDLDTGEDKKDDKEEKITQRERAFTQQRFNTSKNELDGRVNSAYKNTIEANIDPKNQMSDYVKNAAVREATETLQTAIDSDPRFKTIIDKLWEKAIASDFSKDSVDKIRSAFVSKAKTLLPSVIKKARIEALRGIGKRVRDDDKNDNDDNREKKVLKRESRSSNDNGRERKASSNGKIPAGMSTLDYLMKDDE